MSNVEKFTYLKLCLKEETGRKIIRFNVTNENYELAIKTLGKNYNNTSIMKDALYSKLRKLPSVNDSVVSIQKQADNLDRIC